MSKKHDETKNAGTHEIEVAVLPRETWEFVKGLLEQFEEVLQEANELSKAPRDDADRLAALKSLEAVLDLIKLLYPENPQELSGPIFRTYEALLGVQKGAAPNPLFIRRHTDGRAALAPGIERFQGEAAAAMQLFMDAGESKDQAASRVADWVQRFDLKSRRYTPRAHTGITASTIKGWRDKFTGSSDTGIGAMRFQAVLDLECVKNKSPRPAATWVIKTLLGSTFPKKS